MSKPGHRQEGRHKRYMRSTHAAIWPLRRLRGWQEDLRPQPADGPSVWFCKPTTAEDHRLHVGSNSDPEIKARTLDGQAGEHCEIHHPCMCRCHRCSKYHFHHTENIQQSRRAWTGATRRKASFPKPQSKRHSQSSIRFADQREDYTGLQSRLQRPTQGTEIQ